MFTILSVKRTKTQFISRELPRFLFLMQKTSFPSSGMPESKQIMKFKISSRFSWSVLSFFLAFSRLNLGGKTLFKILESDGRKCRWVLAQDFGYTGRERPLVELHVKGSFDH